MFERPDPSFEPSSQTKQALLYVRTRPKQFGPIRHPGYLGLHGYTVDSAAFMLVLILEAAGLLATLFAIQSLDEAPPLGVSALIAAAAVGIDLVLAYFHHRFATGVNSTLAMEAILAKQEGGREGTIRFQNTSDRISSRKRVSHILSLALILLAIIKLAFFRMAANSSDQDGATMFGVTLFLAVAYFITAIIHIRVTGYLLHALWAEFLYKQDLKRFFHSNGSDNVAQNRVIELGPFSEFTQGIKVGTHEIAERPTLDGASRVHMLSATGLLLDTEIEEFSNRIQNKEAKVDLIKKAMELQLRTVAEK